jgi:hypothetical protein
MCSTRSLWIGAEEAIPVSSPGFEAVSVTRRRLTKLLATPKALAQRIGRMLEHRRRGRSRGLIPACHINDGRSYSDRHEDDGTDPRKRLAVHLVPPFRLISSR